MAVPDLSFGPDGKNHQPRQPGQGRSLGNQSSWAPAISGNGRNVFLRDVVAGANFLVNVSTDRVQDEVGVSFAKRGAFGK
jgi:hypothetical protein